MLRAACESGDDGASAVEGFLEACKCGHLTDAGVYWALVSARVGDVVPLGTLFQGLKKACRGGHFHVADWLLTEAGLGPETEGPMIYLFRTLTGSKGNLAAAKWLLARAGPIGDHFEFAESFRRACGRGHLGVVQWLFGHPAVRAMHDEGLGAACWNGHLAVVKWLVAQGVPVRGLKGDDLPLFSACASFAGHRINNIQVQRWLLGQGAVWPFSDAWLDRLKTWSPERDAWMRAVVTS
jgi:hypothetical protein